MNRSATRDGIARLFALACAIAFNAAVVIYLGEHIVHARRPAGFADADASMTLVAWIPPLPAPRARSHARPPAARPAPRHPGLHHRAAGVPNAVSSAPGTAAAGSLMLAPGDDVWPQATLTMEPADDGTARPSFKPDPLGRRPSPIPPGATRMHLRMEDHSWAGRLRQLSRSATCRELAAALSRHPESGSAISASLEKYGCYRR